MSPWEIVIICCAAAFVVGVIAWSVIRKKKGKGCCGCDCSHCCGCPSRKEQK